MTKYFFLAFVLLVAYPSEAQPYKYLVMKGGGIRGIAYTGAIKALEEKNIIHGIEKVAGTSVGAIVGSLFCVGYTALEMEDLMLALDIKTFNDGQYFFIGGQKRLRKKYGWYRGNKLEEWIGSLLEEKTSLPNITFMQLHLLAQKDKHFKDLYVTATNLSKQKTEIFSWETCPDMQVKAGVRASAAVPLYYQALFMDSLYNIAEKPEKGKSYNVYVDGGIMNNYPVTVFKDEGQQGANSISKYTLGLKLERPEQIDYSKNNSGVAPFCIHSFGSYLSALYNIVIEQLNDTIPYQEEKKHTIYISTSNLSPKVRRMTIAQKQLLYNNGLEAARKFFK